jgi:hypothetical protein
MKKMVCLVLFQPFDLLLAMSLQLLASSYSLEVAVPQIIFLCVVPFSTPLGALRRFMECNLPENHSLPAVFFFIKTSVKLVLICSKGSLLKRVLSLFSSVAKAVY